MRILVALDTTEKADAAVAAAAKLARQVAAGGVEVVLLNVYSPWVDTAFSNAPTPEAQLEEVKAARQAYLEEKTGAFAGVPTRVLVEPLGWPAGRGSEDTGECIARVARQCEADIVVVASKHVSVVARLLLGTAVQTLLRLSPCPVLVVRPGAGGPDAGETGTK
jgi:nucleotide-binding universal stress UspA family protein